MRLSNLQELTNITDASILLISDGNIDYKCSPKNLIESALSGDLTGLSLGSTTSSLKNIYSENLSVTGGSINLGGDTTLGGSATFNGATTFNETVALNKSVTFNEDVTFKKGVTFGSSCGASNTPIYINDAGKPTSCTSQSISQKYYLLGQPTEPGSGNLAFVGHKQTYVDFEIDGLATFHADYVVNAVWNDIADYLVVDPDLEIIYGRAYIRDAATGKVRLAFKNERAIGIASDTCGFKLGKNDTLAQIPIAIGGWVLAYTDKIYTPSTPLKVGKDGKLTKASKWDEVFHPARIIASFDRAETETSWHGKNVDGRSWVKVKA